MVIAPLASRVVRTVGVAPGAATLIRGGSGARGGRWISTGGGSGRLSSNSDETHDDRSEQPASATATTSAATARPAARARSMPSLYTVGTCRGTRAMRTKTLLY